MLKKYLPPLLQIAITLLGAFVIIPQDQLGWASVVQLGILFAGAVVAYLVPLLDGPWAGGLKTGMTVLIALLSGVGSYIIAGELTPVAVGLVVLGALNALATEIGVEVRKDAKAISHGFEPVG